MKNSSLDVAIDEFDYPLPAEQIAAFPLPDRALSKLLVYTTGEIKDEQFLDLATHLPAGSTLVLNNTRVIEARLHFTKPTGGVIEIFCLEPFLPSVVEEAMSATSSVQWLCLIGGASKWKPGQLLQQSFLLNGKQTVLTAKYLQKEAESFLIEFSWTGDTPFGDVLEAAGAIPLPPYIKRKPDSKDAERYQTVFATQKGSVAAPTAALHFTEAVLDTLHAKQIETGYLTLHVGAGTFRPVKTVTVAEHPMHAETFLVTSSFIKLLLNATTIIAVGTTSLRTLESLYWIAVKLIKGETEQFLGQWEAYELESNGLTYKESLEFWLEYLQKRDVEEIQCKTSLLILPGYAFKSANGLITNFHQPKSTLLLLIAAFIGMDWKRVYNHALENDYRFLSYGDSSLLWRNSSVDS